MRRGPRSSACSGPALGEDPENPEAIRETATCKLDAWADEIEKPGAPVGVAVLQGNLYSPARRGHEPAGDAPASTHVPPQAGPVVVNVTQNVYAPRPVYYRRRVKLLGCTSG